MAEYPNDDDSMVMALVVGILRVVVAVTAPQAPPLTDADVLKKAIVLLQALTEPHDEREEDGEHAWRECRRCLAREELEYDSSTPLWQAILDALLAARSRERTIREALQAREAELTAVAQSCVSVSYRESIEYERLGIRTALALLDAAPSAERGEPALQSYGYAALLQGAEALERIENVKARCMANLRVYTGDTFAEQAGRGVSQDVLNLLAATVGRTEEKADTPLS